MTFKKSVSLRAPSEARAGLGPCPGWGPVRVGAHMGPYMGPYMGPCGPIWAHVGPYGSSWTGLGSSVNIT